MSTSSSAVVQRFFTARLLNGSEIRTREACGTLLDVKLDLAAQLGTFLPHLELITADFATAIQSDAEVQKLLLKHDDDILIYAVVNALTNTAELTGEHITAHWIGVVQAHAEATDENGVQRAVQFLNGQGGDGDTLARTTLVQLIAQHGATRMAGDSTPQTVSAFRTVVNTFLRAKVDVSKGSAQMRGYTALMAAVEYGLDDILDYLLVRVNPDVTNDQGSTALMFAARKGHLRIVQRLVERGADICMADRKGVNALGYASMCGNHEVVDWIIDNTSTARRGIISNLLSSFGTCSPHVTSGTNEIVLVDSQPFAEA